MPKTADDFTDDTVALRRCVRDLVALSALPAVWARSAIRAIGEGLADVLWRMLPADVVFVRVGTGDAAIDTAITQAGRCDESTCRQMASALAGAIGTTAGAVVVLDELPNVGAALHAYMVPIGYDAANGVIVTASTRSGYPSTIERLLVGVACNAAAVVLERRQTEEHLREDQRIIDTLHRIGASLVSELDRQRLLQMVTDEATTLTGAEFGAFFFNVQEPGGGSYMLYTLAGAPREAFSGMPMPRATELFGPTFRGEAAVRIADVTADRRFGRNPPYHGTPSGHLPVRSYLAVPVKSRSGAVHGGLFFGHARPGMFTDRHERLATGIAAWASLALDNAQLYYESQAASRAKDDFLATVSHELRTPVNAVLGWVSMLSQRVLDEGRTRSAISAIERNARAQVTLIEDLLDVSRFLTGGVRLELSPVDLSETVLGAVDAFQLAARSKNIDITFRIEEHLPSVMGDGARLRQVLWNLVSNAVKFTPESGRIDIAARRDGHHAVAITVTDSGDGIDPAFLPHVFDRFRQGDPSTTREHSGLGLGLWIVRHLVELQGGTVTAESGGRNQGASFTVRLPLATTPASPSG